jgi:hypothetical protein
VRVDPRHRGADVRRLGRRERRDGRFDGLLLGLVERIVLDELREQLGIGRQQLRLFVGLAGRLFVRFVIRLGERLLVWFFIWFFIWFFVGFLIGVVVRRDVVVLGILQRWYALRRRGAQRPAQLRLLRARLSGRGVLGGRM